MVCDAGWENGSTGPPTATGSAKPPPSGRQERRQPGAPAARTTGSQEHRRSQPEAGAPAARIAGSQEHRHPPGPPKQPGSPAARQDRGTPSKSAPPKPGAPAQGQERPQKRLQTGQGVAGAKQAQQPKRATPTPMQVPKRQGQAPAVIGKAAGSHLLRELSLADRAAQASELASFWARQAVQLRNLLRQQQEGPHIAGLATPPQKDGERSGAAKPVNKGCPAENMAGQSSLRGNAERSIGGGQGGATNYVHGGSSGGPDIERAGAALQAQHSIAATQIKGEGDDDNHAHQDESEKVSSKATKGSCKASQEEASVRSCTSSDGQDPAQTEQGQPQGADSVKTEVQEGGETSLIV